MSDAYVDHPSFGAAVIGHCLEAADYRVAIVSQPDCKPEYPIIVHNRILRQLFHDVPIVFAGIEASMRRLTHYHYWQDKLRRCIPYDAGADLILRYGRQVDTATLRRYCRRVIVQRDSRHPVNRVFGP